jgi:hypothetical protein
MRRLTLIVLALMLCSMASAVPITITIDWATSVPARQMYNIAYNPATGHLVGNGGDQLYIFDASDGSFIKNTAISLGGYFPFSLACTSDGVLYGADLNVGQVIHTWVDEDTTSVLSPVNPATPTILGRGLNVRGTSTSPTLYYTGGGDNDKMQILQLDATKTTWTVVSTVAAPAGKSYCGVKDENTIFGQQPWGNDGSTSPNLGFPDVFKKSGPGYAYSTWVRDNVFSPQDATTGGFCYNMGGDWGSGVWWSMLYWDCQLVGYDGVYGTILSRKAIPNYGGLSAGTAAVGYYGNAVVDAPNNTIYFGGRLLSSAGGLLSQGHIGKAHYNDAKPVINEVDYDNAGTDTAEFVEIWGIPGTDISSYTLVGVNGASGTGTPYRTTTIPPGTTIPDDGFYVIGSATVPNVDLVAWVSDGIQNGSPDGLELRDYPGGAVIDALGYEMRLAGSLPASSYEGTGYIGGDESGCNFSLGRMNDGVDTDDNQADFDVMPPTPGEKNQQFTLWSDDMPYVDVFPNPPVLPWKGAFVDANAVDPAAFSVPDSPEAVIPGLIPTASPDMVGSFADLTGGGNVNMLGDHNFAQRNINIQGWVYTGSADEEICLWVRGLGEPVWRWASCPYENLYGIRWFDDGTTSVMQTIKLLSDGSVTVLARNDSSYGTPGWHHLRIFANGTTVRSYVDSAVFANTTDSALKTGPVGIGYREYSTGNVVTGGLVDSVIIDNNFAAAPTAVADWNLF